MALYESDHTIFMRELIAKHPEWAEEQISGRALLWDRGGIQVEQKASFESRIEQRPYPYDVNFPPRFDGKSG